MALGKGLGSLIPMKKNEININSVVDDNLLSILDVNPDKILVNPHQPRKNFNTSELEDLINSIKVHGIIQPLIVSKKGYDRFELIAGERRLRSAKVLNLQTVPVIIRDAKEQEKLEIALIENIQRKQLNAYEEALSYQRLINEFNLTQDDVAKRVGKSRSSVGNIMRLLDLPEEVKQAIMEEKISEGHARAIASLSSISAQLQLLKKITDGKISVRETEKEVKNVKGFKNKNFDPLVIEYEEKLRDIFGTRVEIQKKNNKGYIKIEFASLEDFKGIIEKLM